MACMLPKNDRLGISKRLAIFLDNGHGDDSNFGSIDGSSTKRVT